MQTDYAVEQTSLFDLDTWSGKTCPEPLVQTAAKTSKPSLRKSSKSLSRTPQSYPCLTRGGGPTQTASMEWAQTGSPFPWLGNFTTHSIGVSLKDGKDYAFWLTSTDLQRRGYCLTLNLSERPRAANPTKLSEILEQNPDPKYSLSSRACQGILNRAERRGKELPAELKAALTAQSACKETELTAAIPQAVTEQAGDGGAVTPLTQSTDPPSLPLEPILLESNQNHATIQTDGISTALPAAMGEGGGYVPMVCGNPWDSQPEREVVYESTL